MNQEHSIPPSYSLLHTDNDTHLMSKGPDNSATEEAGRPKQRAAERRGVETESDVGPRNLVVTQRMSRTSHQTLLIKESTW